jgi:ADP-ribose pyrophosphatase
MTNQITSTQIDFATPWFEVVSKRISGASDPFYALRMRDYVSVAAFTERDELILLRQYRPAIERYTLELPSGQVEKDETPATSAGRELEEETGFRAAHMELLGTLLSDTGRHENRLWCFYAEKAAPIGKEHVPEAGLECVLVPRSALRQLLMSGEFDHALHLAVLMLAAARYGPAIAGLI